MTNDSKKQNINALVNEVVADPSRAEAVKEALLHIAEGTRDEEKVRIGKRPARFEVEDFFDNLPV